MISHTAVDNGMQLVARLSQRLPWYGGMAFILGRHERAQDEERKIGETPFCK